MRAKKNFEANLTTEHISITDSYICRNISPAIEWHAARRPKSSPTHHFHPASLYGSAKVV